MAKVVRQKAKRSTKTSHRKAPPPLKPAKGHTEGDLLFIHGKPGVGKTSFAAQFPSPQFVMNEHDRGVLALVRHKQIPALQFPIIELKTWQDCLCIKPAKGVQTLVIDTITDIPRIMFADVCDADYDSGKEFWSWGHQGVKNCATREWPFFFQNLSKIAMQGVTVVVVGHSQVTSFDLPGSITYKRWEPDLHKDLRSHLMGWANAVLFMYIEIDVEKPRGSTKAYASGGEDRNIYTEMDALWDAKNQMGLPYKIDMGNSGAEAYANFLAALKQEKPKKKRSDKLPF